MFCTKCGKENGDDAITCIQCGATLGEKESPAPETSSGSNFWKGFAIAIIVILAISALIRVTLWYVHT